MSNKRHPKPNDKSSNVERIREIVRNTEGNLTEAEISKEFADPIQREVLSEKNERRKQSIEELKEEIKEEIAKRQLPKTGKNTYSNYNYYQLEDIMPSIIELCNKYNLFTKPTFNKDEATLIIIDCDAIKNNKTPIQTTYNSPMKDIDMKGANAIQCLGGVETYQRRYLYMAAFDITEGDMFDGEIPKKGKKQSGTQTPHSDKVSKCAKYFAGLKDSKDRKEVIDYLMAKGYKSFTELEKKNNITDIEEFMKKFNISMEG